MNSPCLPDQPHSSLLCHWKIHRFLGLEGITKRWVSGSKLSLCFLLQTALCKLWDDVPTVGGVTHTQPALLTECRSRASPCQAPMCPCLTDFIFSLGNSYELQPLCQLRASLSLPVSTGTGPQPIWSGSPGPSLPQPPWFNLMWDQSWYLP